MGSEDNCVLTPLFIVEVSIESDPFDFFILLFLRTDSHQMLDLFHMPEAGRFEPADDAVDKAASLLYYVWISGVMKKPSVPAQHPEDLPVKLFAIELPGEGKTRWIVNDRIEGSRRHCAYQLKTTALTLHNPLLP